MLVKYINKEPHEVSDDRSYFFVHDEEQEVPDQLGEFLIRKFPQSFIKVFAAKEAPKKNIVDAVREIEEETNNKIMETINTVKFFKAFDAKEFITI